MDLASKKIQTLASGGVFGPPAWSPDGKQLAYKSSRPAPAVDRLEVISIAGKQRRRIVSVAEIRHVGNQVGPLRQRMVWLPDQQSLLATFQHYEPFTRHIWEVRLDGTSRHLAAGEVLAQSHRARKVLLKLDDKYWLVELGGLERAARK